MNTGADLSLFGPTLDVAIGLVLIYVLYSLLLSTVVEAIASVAKLRARGLEAAILRLIDTPHPQAQAQSHPQVHAQGQAQPHAKKPTPNPMVGASIGMFKTAPRGPAKMPAAMAANPLRVAGDAIQTTLGESVYGHALVAGLAGKFRPSYVSADHFATALLDVLREAGDGSLFSDSERAIAALPHGQLRQALASIVREAQGDWNHLRHGVEAWYNEAMDRLNGDYKRFIQTVTFVLGLLLAGSLNIDSIDLVKKLWVEKDIRAALVQKAETETKDKTVQTMVAQTSREGTLSGPETTPQSPAAPSRVAKQPTSDKPAEKNASSKQADGTKDPYAEIPEDIKRRQTQLLEIAPKPGPYVKFGTPAFFSQVGGWVLTALAGMLGAPFWFELLQRLVNLRGAGPKPDVRKPPKT